MRTAASLITARLSTTLKALMVRVNWLSRLPEFCMLRGSAAPSREESSSRYYMILKKNTLETLLRTQSTL